MFIPKANRIAIYSDLFKEGVVVVKKERRGPHGSIEGVSNLEVMMLMQSLTSKAFVKTTFSWQYSYCYLLPEGVEYLRTYLALPAEIVPNTLKKAAVRPGGREQEEEGKKQFGGEGKPAFKGGDREYRKAE
ncbi:hypothetical protein ScalyP_jg995 [Parmales sp. scaly parma]|nr:hypothetical protein ScalyP_jg995 [Parmales sp. scaly parma]|tara:strand:- start:731 stop:1123 length:393 start_codon:yes stop_codon:yes gene_type:complete